MLQRLIQWLKQFFQRLFGGKQNPVKVTEDSQKEVLQPLDDTDLEFLFMELLEGVHQARGQAWAQKWLHNIEDRISTEGWVNWLQRFGERLLASPTPNNEIASRMVQLGELEIGEVGDVAYDIGMQLLRRSGDEPVWEYDGPDVEITDSDSTQAFHLQGETGNPENLPQGELQTISLEQLFAMLQNDEHLRLQIAQQLGIETDDPQVIIQALVNQFNGANQESEELG
ncbi:hypothetical protein G7B40_001880 [Aetokthonos hydrillicola Thurmond2011]|jgi:hypothetical protein|uniref:Uncharacterized protein n=1 Tax=Aetokthonos hydrillicola Thurmond2011 TaxID=2712845 RepID=A0AAP5I211_9CYAN|nr:hypothetical protein [Aetokthonos hydrillicola]MBO3462795.1 hypothetical protein [Aetokthonos hydrillicola CCALA 1050]MBW4590192.1 hypothetical protein [Aetokthonos hydrillicola CCALA 1050]MDR9893336.1 hypothetical protein [Aetokthonos hydrillicola Thurmond2011]